MKKLLATICAGAVLGLMASCDDAPDKAKAYNQGINIIPTPVSLTQNEGNFKLNKNTKIYASTPEAKTVAERRHAHTGVQGICPSVMRYELTIAFWGRAGALAPCHVFSGNSQVVVEKTLVFHSLTWDSR